MGTFTGTQTFQDSVSSGDRNDFYKLNLDAPGTLEFSLTGMSADANIILANNSGKGISGSGKPGTRDEHRAVPNLAAGDYYVKVVQKSGATNYDLTLNLTSDPQITLISPNGGDQLEPGENFNITWTDNISENVNINLYRDDTYVQTIAANTPSDGQATWTVPTNLPISDRYKIKVSQFGDNSVVDFSDDYFSIKPEIIPVTHKVNDFNGDGKHDILWRNYETGVMHAWKMDGLTWKQGEDIDMPDILDSAWHPVATGDFNNDGHTDIVTRYYWKDNSGHNRIWLMNENQITEQVTIRREPGLDWHISGTGDFNKDGDIDLLWRNYKNGENHVWLMDGTNYIESVALETVEDPDSKIVGTGDFDKDGNVDIVWRNGNTNGIWMMDGTELRESVSINSTGHPAWKMVGTGDFNEDGNIDLLWRENLTGDMGVWLMDGTEVIGNSHSNWGSHDPSFHIVGETDPIPTWTAEYFNNKDLSGSPVHVEGVGNSYYANDYNKLFLNWGSGSPAGTPEDGFSAKFKTRRYLAPGLYQIKTGSDDGIRVNIDGQYVTNQWIPRAGNYSGYFYSTGKEHDIKVDYFDNTHSAAIDLEIKKATNVSEPTDESQVWRSSIYNWNPTEANQPPQDFFAGDNRAKGIGSVSLGSHTRSDGKFGLSVDWQNGAIYNNSDLPHDNFAIRAYTHKHLEAGKTYKLWVRGDDGFQFFAKKWHTDYRVNLLTNERKEPTQWEQNYGAAKPYEFTVDHTGWYDFHFHLYEGGGSANFDFALEEGCDNHGGYYSELDNLSDNQWDEYSGDNTRFDGAFCGGEVDERHLTPNSIKQIYTDLSHKIFGSRVPMTAGYAHDQSYHQGFGTWHAGIDMGISAGTNVKAVVGGNVAWISAPGTDNSFIGINSDDGRQWVYGHVGNLSVSQGQRVNSGDNIAKIGYANHLHLEVENGHAYGGTNGAHTSQSHVKNVTLSPLQAYWELENADGNHENCDN
ncbi:MAG: FG-GAP-like repeat-containing protein [Pleurocapsa sp.]